MGTTVPIQLDLPVSCYWVVPASFMAGAHPGFGGEERILTALRALRSQGIETFVDLTEAGECVDYEPLLAAEPPPGARVPEYRRIAVPDMSVPSRERMSAVLDLIDDTRSRGRALYLHCLGGLGRTGTVVGCHLVRNGLTGEEALERIDALRVDLVNAFSFSPVTDEQERFVKEWRVGS